MASIVPPLDFPTKLPGRAVDSVINQINKQTDQLLDSVSKTLQDSNKLPKNVKCDDPKVDKIKKQLADVQKQITQLQQTIPKIQQTINSVKTVVGVAQGIKATITATQLSIPATAGLFVATQLMAIQDATIVNAIASLKQFETIPKQLTAKLQQLTPPLLAAFSKISSACNGDVDNLELPESSLNPNTVSRDYNDEVDTEFYNEFNVSDSDLTNRSVSIEQLLTQQQDLLSSLTEAPSKVYQQPGVPPVDLGKPGDYYIDTTNSNIYGPKISNTDWGQAVN